MSYYVGSMKCGKDDLVHYGIVGMKWGNRRYQNPDGTLTAEGKARYAHSPEGLGYTPLRGKTGDHVQKTIGRETLRNQKMADKFVGKADKYRDSGNRSKADKAMKKAKSYLDNVDRLKEWQKTYASMSKTDRDKIRSREVGAKAVAFTLGLFGMPLATFELAKNRAVLNTETNRRLRREEAEQKGRFNL